MNLCEQLNKAMSEGKKIKIKDLDSLKLDTNIRVTTDDGDWIEWEKVKNQHDKKYGEFVWAVGASAKNTANLPPYASDKEFKQDFVTSDDKIEIK